MLLTTIFCKDHNSVATRQGRIAVTRGEALFGMAAGLGFMGVAALFSMTTAPIRVYSQEIVSPGWRAAMSGALIMGAGLSASAMALK